MKEWTCIVLGLALAGCAKEDIASKFPDSWDRMGAAKSATAYRLRTGQIISKGVDLTPEQVLEVRSLLQDSNTYEPDELLDCIPNPGVLIRFEGKGGADADLELCFECSILLMHPREVGLGVGKVHSFDVARPQLHEPGQGPIPAR
ncbi:MAG: hypothetical protein ACR2HJ_06545 [Fimbriimonadales bacterium]